ncbi:hypothetical protein B1689_16255 [Geobacillus sp. 44C]|nr:hypothetical protein B1689_16255 [Geobacillus sp. 44C]QNU35699.1 glycosyltransferase [Geobacillus sp. 44C]
MNKSEKVVCFLSAHLPSSKSKQAGQKIAYNNLFNISREYKVILISFANSDEIRDIDNSLYSLCEEVVIIPINNFYRFLNAIINLLVPWFISFRSSRKVYKKIKEINKKYTKVIFWLEYEQMIQYVKNNKSVHNYWIVVCHDIISQMFERKRENAKGIKKVIFDIEYRRLKKWEKQYLQMVDEVIVLSQKDALLLSDYNVKSVTVGFPQIPDSKDANDLQLSPNPSIIFFGAMNRIENEDAVLWFLEKIYPLIRNELGDIDFTVVGAHPSSKLIAICNKYSNVKVTGFVEDPGVYFQKAWLAVAPLRLGAGIKVKVLESLAQGVPVVATKVGAEGIDASEEEGLYVRDSEEEFARTCINLLSNPINCMSKKIQALYWIKKHYKQKELNSQRIASVIRKGMNILE